MEKNIRTRVRDALAPVGVELETGVEKGFDLYLRLLTRWSRRVRLVGSVNAETVALKHFADSLVLLPFLREVSPGQTVLDIGSGAGFPGVPLALARPDLRVVFVEPDSRKAAFLASVVADLGLEKAAVLMSRAEGDPVAEGAPLSSVVVSRALLAPESWVGLGSRYVEEGGLLLGMMGARSPGNQELQALGEDRGLTLWRVWRGELPGIGRRAVAAWRQRTG